MTATTFEHRCSECGELAIVSTNPDEPAYCAEHPRALINSCPVESAPTYTVIEDNGGGLHLYVFDAPRERCLWAAESMGEEDVRVTVAALRRGESPGGCDTTVEDYGASWAQWTEEQRRNGGWHAIADEDGVDYAHLGAAGKRIFGEAP